MQPKELKFFKSEGNPFRNPFPRNIPVIKPRSRKKEPQRRKLFMLFILVAMLTLVLAPVAFTGGDITELVPGTAVLLNQSSGSGNGGNSTSTSSSTNIFSPAAFVDYKRFGGEPTVVVDRYPFPGTNASPGAQCPSGQTTCFKDIAYQSAPQGFVAPRYSNFYKSDDLEQTFRVPAHTPTTTKGDGTGQGGGDSHQVVGAVSHKVYYVDLALSHITINVSSDLGETWTTGDASDTLGALLDDRQWVEADENAPLPAGNTGNVYISAINLEDAAFPTLIALRSTHGALPTTTFNTDSPCSTAMYAVGANPLDPSANDGTASPCPDPSDPYLWVAGPIVADKTVRTSNTTHPVYVPFVRRISEGGLGLECPPCAWQLYIAKSTDGGAMWTRVKIADLPNTVDPGNIFVQMAIDRAGNLYYTWSQTQNVTADSAGEQDIYYTFSTNGGISWAPPINLTGEIGDSAVFAWMVAGDPGRVDLVFYKSNNGVNSNVAPPDTVWNVYFAQSLNALNTGPNFKTVQVSTEPNHVGALCTGGLSCSGDRDLLDFITVDIDHLGAAVIAYSDDHQSRNSDTRDKSTRQIAGTSVFKNQTITLQSSWPIKDHAVSDRAGDTYTGFGTLTTPPSCPGMDLVGASALTASRLNDLLTISLTLNNAPTAMEAVDCSGNTATGGRWGAEFWAAAGPADGGTEGGNHFYVAYRDNPAEGSPGVEAGYIDNVSLTDTTLEFHPKTGVTGTLGGTCVTNPTSSPCTLTMTINLSALSITPGNGLYSITGLSTYFFGNAMEAPALVRLEGGNSEQADATVAFHYLGSGTP
jgi:hypothetical protein